MLLKVKLYFTLHLPFNCVCVFDIYIAIAVASQKTTIFLLTMEIESVEVEKDYFCRWSSEYVSHS